MIFGLQCGDGTRQPIVWELGMLGYFLSILPEDPYYLTRKDPNSPNTCVHPPMQGQNLAGRQDGSTGPWNIQI